MTRYIWAQEFWPKFSWNEESVTELLLSAKRSQGYILGQASFLELNEQADILIEEAFHTSAIEGELLDRTSIRSSVARRLGLEFSHLPEAKRNTDGLVAILFDACNGYERPLTDEILFGWHHGLFPDGYSGIQKIRVGSYRISETPMQVVSGALGRERVHFEAPPSKLVKREMKKFLKWWNGESLKLDGLIRAAIAHLWFITIHPFEDGNGLIARALTDMALASDEKLKKRVYSLSVQIMKYRKTYYEILEKCQKGDGDITKWLCWFLDIFQKSIEGSKIIIEKTIFINRFYRHHVHSNLNERQMKVIKKLLDSLPEDFIGGMTNKKYVSITKTSSETAKRDLKELVEKGVLLLNDGKGRSVSYRLNRAI